MKDFLAFIREQGVVGLAVGFILGGAVSKLVAAIVNDLINPIISIPLRAVGDIKTASWSFFGESILWGDFVTVMIDFIIVSFVVYFGVKVLQIGKLDKKKEVK